MYYKKPFLIVFVFSILLSSCNKEESFPSKDIKENNDLSQENLSKETLQQISNLHFNPDGAETFDFLMPDGTTKESILVEGDIVFSKDQLNQMNPSSITTKQYHTYNLVSSPRTINVIGYTGTGYGQNLTSKQKSALQNAISKYNALNLGITFTLTFGTNYSPYDIVVYQNPNGQAGGVSGFPSGGNPYKYIQIYSGMQNYSLATNTHVVMHEMGHTIGLRHTDWDTRASCGQTGESADPDGAVHIPGTPTGYDSNSVMLACFSANETGNFGYYDEVALDYLY